MKTLELEGLESGEKAQQRWREQLACWRSEAEERCESRIRAAVLERAEPNAGDIAEQAAEGMSSLDGWNGRQLDAELRRLAATLAGHELKLSRLLSDFHRADGWRRLGYATEAQYARERLGVSRSSVLARRSLASGLAGLPQVALALGSARIGVEAALQLVRVATPQTALAWLERARQRTVKHLREEVSAALTAVRVSGDADCPPPSEDELERVQELERAVLRGKYWVAHRTVPNRAALSRSPMSRSAAPRSPHPRDRCCCSSPVCSRRDVTPHHLQFRSAGGSDEDDNMASLCTWCHLFGVHGGRIRATGSAGNIRSELGSREAPCVRVEGRQRWVAMD